MPSFDDLDYDAQVALLTQGAKMVLRENWLQSADIDVTCIQHFQNSTLRVEDQSTNTRYALRINRPGAQSTANIRSELQWLTALANDTDLHIPMPIPTRDGALFIQATPPQHSGRVYTLFKWLEGDMLDDALTTNQIRAVGEFMGALHSHSATWQPPEGFSRKSLEWDGQMDEHYRNIAQNGSSAVDSAMWQTFVNARAKVEPIMRGLGDSPEVFGLIHNDIYQKNMLFVGDSVRVLDFDNCGWGHYLLDIAVTLAKLLPHDDYDAKRDALLNGYRAQHPLSDTHADLLDHFIAARIMLLALYLAGQMHHPGMRAIVPDFVRSSAQQLKHWLENGHFS